MTGDNASLVDGNVPYCFNLFIAALISSASILLRTVSMWGWLHDWSPNNPICRSAVYWKRMLSDVRCQWPLPPLLLPLWRRRRPRPDILTRLLTPRPRNNKLYTHFGWLNLSGNTLVFRRNAYMLLSSSADCNSRILREVIYCTTESARSAESSAVAMQRGFDRKRTT